MSDDDNSKNGATSNGNATNGSNENEQENQPLGDGKPANGNNGQPLGDGKPSNDESNDDPGVSRETFDKDYVQGLRHEAKSYRTRLRDTEQLAKQRGEALLSARVAATGLLADPSDVAYTDELLDGDDDALRAHIDQLLTQKPHLRAVNTGGGGLPNRHEDGSTVSLASLLRGNA